jgi:hypothetical protein
VNPDGSNYSQTIATNVKKKCSPTAAVDINRNYDFCVFLNLFHHQQILLFQQAPTSEVDHRSSLFSEPETRVKIAVNVQV